MLDLSSRFFARGREFLGCEYPFLCGAMTWVSDPQLVAAVCNAGGFASLAGGNTPPGILAEQIRQTRALTSKPFAVNLVTLSPAYPEQMAMLRQEPVPYVIFAGAIPRGKDIELIKSTGAKVMCFASAHALAMRTIKSGADALILEGTEAGGHIGPVSLTVLLQQVLFDVTEVPVFVAGGIGSGRFCAHLFMMGAAGVQLGTRFAVSKESCAHPDFKRAYIRASDRDAVATPQFDIRIPVVPVRALHNKGTDEFGKLQLELIGRLERGEITRTEAQYQVEHFWMGALRRAVVEGDVEHGSMMAGQSVGLVKRIESVAEILADLVQSTESELQLVREKLV
ncbi:MAG: nitronate monooxygenase [Lentisphaeria bacterium]|nr:nitronate monooxygenase [Lentisphaeria bacterium]